MLSRWLRTWVPRGIYPITALLHRLGVIPNQLTFASLVAAVISGWFVSQGHLGWAAVGLIFSGIFDSLDGELARQFHQETRLGPFLDSVADHYGDFAIYLGIAWFALHLPGGDQTLTLLTFASLFGSVVGSHIRSRAGMLGVDTKRVGFFTRMERTLVLLAGFLTGWVLPAVAILAAATNLSALQRFLFVMRAAGRMDDAVRQKTGYETPK